MGRAGSLGVEGHYVETNQHKIALDNVSRVFPPSHGSGQAITAIEEVNITVDAQEVVCLVGPSGCGKTTILNLVAGFDRPDRGAVSINGQQVRSAGPDRSVVFQSPALFPWLTVFDNIAFGPKKRGVAASQYRQETQDYIRTMGLRGFERHYPYQLSGGMKQRVQIARAMINQPDVLLMDEPFGALDFQTRLVMQEELQRLCAAYHPTILFITHDVEEAIFLADRIYVMTARPGRIKAELRVPFAKPRTFDVVTEAHFVGLKEQLLHLLRHEYLEEGVRRC
ncbi:MAG: ABC transporter ATP-binding protein [Pseudomonadota bacterium]|nr:ABC transporter ATP-binding protein [Pseudomonadota bacterium]